MELIECNECGRDVCWIIRDDPYTCDLVVCFDCAPPEVLDR